jgi:hypothetical protein
VRLANSAAKSGRLRFPARRESANHSPDGVFLAGRVPRCGGVKTGGLANIADGNYVGRGTRRGFRSAIFLTNRPGCAFAEECVDIPDAALQACVACHASARIVVRRCACRSHRKNQE